MLIWQSRHDVSLWRQAQATGHTHTPSQPVSQPAYQRITYPHLSTITKYLIITQGTSSSVSKSRKDAKFQMRGSVTALIRWSENRAARRTRNFTNSIIAIESFSNVVTTDLLPVSTQTSTNWPAKNSSAYDVREMPIYPTCRACIRNIYFQADQRLLACRITSCPMNQNSVTSKH